MGGVERRLILFLATGIGVGYFPLFPGTMGTFLAVPLSFVVNRLAAHSLLQGSLMLLGFICAAVWVSSRGEVFLARKDPGQIVIDEIAGFLVANFIAPPGLMSLALAFALFRIFDIVKAYPASRLQTLPGGLGIVLDDVIAGIYTFIILRVFAFLGLI